MEIIFILATLVFAVIVTFICKKAIKKLELPEIEWYDQNEIPEEIRVERTISKDVLIVNLETKTLHIGYYSYGNDCWVVDGFAITPNKFNWAYLN
jgi:predicted membrane protein